MPLELSLPFLALSGAAITAVAWRFWPRIAVRTHAEKHGTIGIREIAVSLTRPRFGRIAAGAGAAATRELVIYMTVKSCNQ
jgi:peptidyl-tRNA hydrolase